MELLQRDWPRWTPHLAVGLLAWSLIGSVQLRAHGVTDGAGLFLIDALSGVVSVALGWWPSRVGASGVQNASSQ